VAEQRYTRGSTHWVMWVTRRDNEAWEPELTPSGFTSSVVSVIWINVTVFVVVVSVSGDGLA
jgi:hypothetical protein